MKNKFFKPDYVFKKIYDLDFDILKGIKTLFIDIDNTLTPYYQELADEKTKKFINKLNELNIKIILVSNNNKNRVKRFAESLDLEFNYLSMKPLPFTFLKLIKKYKLNKNETMAIGDQILTDVLAANLTGIYSCYVYPIIDKDSFMTSINRKIENIIRRIYKI